MNQCVVAIEMKIIINISKKVEEDKKVFPDVSLEKKENIFPSFPEINKTNSFFDEDEFKDLSNYMEDNKKNSWF